VNVPSRLAAITALAILGACGTDPVQLTPPIAVRTVLSDTTNGHASLLVRSEAPADIDVTYTAPGEPTFNIRLEAFGDSLIVPLEQLRPGHVYEYAVRTINEAGTAGPVARGTITAPGTPAALAALHFSATGSTDIPAVLLEVSAPSFTGFVAVNEFGEPVWWYRTAGNPQGSTVRRNGNFVFIDAIGGLTEVTPAGTVVHQLPAHFEGNHLPHHDVIATPANTLLFIAQDPILDHGQYLVGDAIYEWNPETGAVQKRWSSFDFYDPRTDIGERSTTTDLLHSNSLALGDHNNVILSLNWISQVISIAPDWKTIEWRMGGPHSTMTLDSSATFQGQHTAAVLPNGHMLVFDNARDRTGAAKNSAAREIAFTPVGRGQLVWSFTPSATQYDPYVGAARRLANGNTLVYFGMHDGFAGAVGPMGAYEVRPSGNIAWQLIYDGGNINYRATPLETIAGERKLTGSRFALPE
jgi:hypothetical protein